MDRTATFTIREARCDDLEHIYFHWLNGVEQALVMELDPLHDVLEERYKESFLEKFRSVSCIFKIWVAVNDADAVIGWQYLMPFENNPAVRHLSAEFSTYISPTHRGQGIGTALLAKAIAHARHSPLQYIVGYVAEDNARMQAVCEKLGFLRSGEYPLPLKKPLHGRTLIYILPVPAA